jgi:hypothetical protein
VLTGRKGGAMLEVIDKGRPLKRILFRACSSVVPTTRLCVGLKTSWASSPPEVSVSSRELARPRRKYAVHTPELVFNRRLR